MNDREIDTGLKLKNFYFQWTIGGYYPKGDIIKIEGKNKFVEAKIKQILKSTIKYTN